MARAERIPDIKIEALYHRLEATEENTLDLGLSVSIPVFNRNRGRLREAQARVAQAEARRRVTRMELDSQIRQACAGLKTALNARSLLSDELLPRAEVLLKTSEARFSEGDIHLGELLAVRREWALLKLTHLESLREVMQAWIDLSSFVVTNETAMSNR